MTRFNLKFSLAACGLCGLFALLFFCTNDGAVPVPMKKLAPAAEYISFAATPQIRNGYFLNDRFSTAPVEWRTAGAALCSVAQRWQCEPKWTFMSLENDRKKGKAAVLWCKRIYPGDVKVEFFFGNRQDHLRGNPFYYVRDVNVTIASDGVDLNKGYTFSYGGFNNTCSYIMRNGAVVKTIPVKIPQVMDYLRHWFRVTVERTGGRLAFSVDHFFADGSTGRELVYEDPEPLVGDRIALWTYDNSISIAKVRISGESDGSMESPDQLFGELKTVYDDK